MDAITLLRKEHSNVRKSLSEIQKLSHGPIKQQKFDALCQDLIRHETMEQKVWYPALRKYPDLRDIIKHLVEEEKGAAAEIKKFNKASFEFIWDLRFIKFKHDVNHHAKTEESELFPKVNELLTKEQLKVLGDKMQKFKDSYK